MEKFKLRARKQKKYFQVLIYDKLKRLRSDTDKLDARKGESSDNSEIVGVVQPFEKIKVYPDGREEKSDLIGFIRLHKKNLGGSIVAHELVHAAFWQYRLTQQDGNANFGDGFLDMKNEEDFAHIYDNLAHDMFLKLYKHKLW